MKCLIINVDDVGLSSVVNEAARICYENGCITGVSVMPCGQAFSQSAEMLQELDKTEVGVHLTLTGNFTPATKTTEKIKTIVRENGCFFAGYKDILTKYLVNKINPDEVFLEWENQIEQILKQNLKITHIDSHEHVHMFPKYLNLAIKLARKYNIKYIRIPRENNNIIFKDFSIKDAIRYSALRLCIGVSPRLNKEEDIKENDAFLGHFHAGRIDKGIFEYMFKNLEDGVTELGVHLCQKSDEFQTKFPWYKNAHKELEALLSLDITSLCEQNSVKLILHSQI